MYCYNYVYTDMKFSVSYLYVYWYHLYQTNNWYHNITNTHANMYMCIVKGISKVWVKSLKTPPVLQTPKISQPRM